MRQHHVISGNSTMTTTQAVSLAPILEAEQAAESKDIAFFTDIAIELGGPILELGCGSGRMAIPIAQAGIEIVGLDLSSEILRYFRKKIRPESLDTRKRITLVCGDMKDLPLKKRFRGIFCSSNTLFLLGTEGTIGKALASARRCLAPDGILVFDTAAIDNETRTALANYPKGDLPDLELSEGAGGGQIQRTHSIAPRGDEQKDAEARDRSTRFSITYKYFDAHNSICYERKEDIILPDPRDLRRLLREHGYQIEKEFGWYDRRPFSDGDRKMIMLARKKE